MEFNPNNNVIKLCVQGMDMEEKGKPEEDAQGGQLGGGCPPASRRFPVRAQELLFQDRAIYSHVVSRDVHKSSPALVRFSGE